MATATMEANVSIHPFEAAGLGLAPFRYAGMSEKVYVACQGAPEQPSGTCDYCGMGIKYCCHIQSSDGKKFIVGCDCVRKLERDDNRLVSAMERDVAKKEKAKRDAKRAAKWEAARIAREHELQSQRDRNGGMTDQEIANAQKAREENELAARMAKENDWLLTVLDEVPYVSSFVDGIKTDLLRRKPETFSERCLEILADIYAKTKSKKNRSSKQYLAAIEEFDAKTRS